MDDLVKRFGEKCFDDKKMKERLPSPVYAKWKETLNRDNTLDRETADAIAHAMKEWAIENGCTHFTHWFQPLSGVTAHKHDAFLDFDDEGETISKFSGKNLIKGEPDASSFPSGGLRATFEARGYTYWDCTSPAFIIDNVLYIPTIFVSYTGQALDTKAPLLKSMELISKSATRILNIFGDKKVTSVTPVVGLEQEYFLVNIEDFHKRSDLLLTGKTLFGAMPSKGQELETHYFGAIPSRVHEFMKDVNEQLWALGIYAKSEHNEVAPGQFELAPIFANCNVAIDQNFLIMETLQNTALKHGMVCLLHEKPFKGINGSGKHNNWSLIADTGFNCFAPGNNPHENVQFLVFVAAFIKAVDEHQDLIRLYSSCPGNDFRLGANEAPPAIVSIFLGDAIEGVFNQLIDKKPKDFKKSELKEYGISTLSYMPHDNTDRNRTSPVAFTGNKFEVRMLGSSMSAGYLNIALNTIMADSLNEIAAALESHKYRQDIRENALNICASIYKKHQRIVFGGDGYSESWVKEAEKRGLLNIKSFVESIDYAQSHNSGEVFIRNGVFSKEDLEARYDIMYENYYKVRSIDIKTAYTILEGEVYPVIASNIRQMSKLGDFTPKQMKRIAAKLSTFVDESAETIEKMKAIIQESQKLPSYREKGLFIRQNDGVLSQIREGYDGIEEYLDKGTLPYPTYQDFFFKLDY